MKIVPLYLAPKHFKSWYPSALLVCLGLLLIISACREIVAPPNRASIASTRFLSPSGTVVITPSSMHGWVFYNDQQNALCIDASVCRLVQGPTGQPLGAGSAELAASIATEGKALVLPDYRGIRFDSITTLRYSAYRQTADPGNNVAIALQVNVDYDLTDAATGYQGRLVFEPYQGNGAGVPRATWQTWDARGGKWWGTNALVPKNGTNVPNSCLQSTPCTWAQLLTVFPDVGVHATYGAVILKAGSGWVDFRGNVDNVTIGVSGITTTFDFELEAAIVPVLPPDTIPSIVNDSSQFVLLATQNEAGMRVHRSVLSIEFEDTVSQVTRSSIIASIGGRVIGGEPYQPGGDGPYFVLVPDDPTGESNLSLGYDLSKRSTVVSAYPLLQAPTANLLGYLRPRDGAGWASWEVDYRKSTSAHHTWALEMIRAPFAWGCETGTAATKIAVLDGHFHTESQLATNRVFTDARDLVPSIGNQTMTWHGDAVSELIAAHGNDSSGMTGVMWRAALSQYEISELTPGPGTRSYKSGAAYSTPRSAKAALLAAARGGARVINISTYLPGATAPVTTADSARLTPWAKELSAGMRTIETKLHLPLPLLVIIAGNNNGIDAGASGLPLLVNDPRYGKDVLVVGASTFGASKTVGAAVFSSTGPLVSLFAPGSGVFGIDPSGADQRINGTSFAAPLVSGVAGLLASFDPSLDAATIKQLILAGAQNSGRTVVDASSMSYPLLDAYEALRAAAGRPGAPLCGNRVFSTASGDVFAERAGSVDEKLFRSIDGTAYTDLLNVLHGGRRIQIGDYLEFDWSSATRKWNAVPLTGDYHQGAGGAFLSWYDGTDHSGEHYAIANQTAGGFLTNTWGVSIYPNGGGGGARELATNSFAQTEQYTDVCGRVADDDVGGYNLTGCPTYDLVGSGWRESVQSAQVAFAPQGNFILVGANRRYHEQFIDPPVLPCEVPYPLPHSAGHCAYYRPARDSSVGVELWLVDTSSVVSTWTPLKVDANAYNRSGLNVSWLAVDETGTELVWELGKDVSVGSIFTCTQRVIEYRALPGHATIAPGGLARPTITLPSGCSRNFGPATFSPYRAGAGPVLRLPRALPRRIVRPRQ